MCDLHLHRLHLQVFGRDPAYFVCDFISLDWDVFPLDVWDVNKDVFTAVGRLDETVTLRPGEVLTYSFKNWTWESAHSGRVCAGAFGQQWAGQFSRQGLLPSFLPHPAPLAQEGEGQGDRAAGGAQRGPRGRCETGVRHVRCDKEEDDLGVVGCCRCSCWHCCLSSCVSVSPYAQRSPPQFGKQVWGKFRSALLPQVC